MTKPASAHPVPDGTVDAAWLTQFLPWLLGHATAVDIAIMRRSRRTDDDASRSPENPSPDAAAVARRLVMTQRRAGPRGRRLPSRQSQAWPAVSWARTRISPLGHSLGQTRPDGAVSSVSTTSVPASISTVYMDFEAARRHERHASHARVAGSKPAAPIETSRSAGTSPLRGDLLDC